MQVDPSLKHRLDLHESIKQLGVIRGLPVGILRQDDEVEALVAQEAVAAEAEPQAEQVEAPMDEM